MVINIKKRVLAIASALLALFVFGWAFLSTPAQAANPCGVGEVQVTVLGSGLRVCVSSSSLPTVTVTLPRVTTTVTLPRRTVTLPRATTVRTVKVPGGTVTKHNVVTVTRDSQVRTVAGQVVTKSATITRPAVTSTVTATQTVHTHSTEEVVVTKTVAAGLGLLFVLIGAALALLLLWGAYTYGWLQGDAGNRRFLRELRDDIKFKD